MRPMDAVTWTWLLMAGCALRAEDAAPFSAERDTASTAGPGTHEEERPTDDATSTAPPDIERPARAPQIASDEDDAGTDGGQGDGGLEASSSDGGLEASSPDASSDAGTVTPDCLSGSYTFTFTRTTSYVDSTTITKGGGSTATTGGLRAWRASASIPNHYYFRFTIAGETNSGTNLVGWSASPPTATQRSFAFGGGFGGPGNQSNAPFPFTGCHSGSMDRNKGSLGLSSARATVTVICTHPVQHGPLPKDRVFYTTTWKGTGTCDPI